MDLDSTHKKLIEEGNKQDSELENNSVLPKASHSESSSAPPLSQSPSIIIVVPPSTTVAAMALDSSQENSNEQVGTGDSGPPSAVSPLAPSTT